MNWFTRMRQKQGIKSMQILSWSVWSAWFFLILICLCRIFFWNIGETGLEIQTEIQEKAGLRWPLLGLGQTHGSAGPRLAPLALSFMCVARLGVVCCVRYVLLPHTGLLPAILFKNTWKQNKTLPVWKPGSWSFIELSNMGAHYIWREIPENKCWKVKW